MKDKELDLAAELVMDDKMDPMEFAELYNKKLEEESKEEDYGFRYHEHI